MDDLNAYLEEHFLNERELSSACGISVQELADLVEHHLVPGPTYTVSGAQKVSTVLFGEMEAIGARPGRYFPPANAVWIQLARNCIQSGGHQAANEALRTRFAQNYREALTRLNQSTCRLHECFDEDGSPIEEGLRAKTDSTWKHFLHGTFGMCTFAPDSEARIAEKGALQAKLTAMSDNGSRTEYSAEEERALRDVIDAYTKVSMPFSPAEYPISSRKRLVDDLLAQLDSVKTTG